jgi:hypothetical protein
VRGKYRDLLPSGGSTGSAPAKNPALKKKVVFFELF